MDKNQNAGTKLEITGKETAGMEELHRASDENWMDALTLDKNGRVQNTPQNLLLIFNYDENLQSIVFNAQMDGIEIKGNVPWKHPSSFWRDADDAQLISYLDEHYGTFSRRNYETALMKITDDRSYHPVREYLGDLPLLGWCSTCGDASH